jgi:cellulose synthase/poly-beta-1,6-N-acetylglucosamine synthase-like glycosyltransferase
MTLRTLVEGYGVVVVAYFSLLGVASMALTVLAWRRVAGHRRAERYAAIEEAFASPLTPAVSVLLPVHDEAPVVAERVRSLLGLRFPRHEVVVVNDGSTDSTLDELIHDFELVPVPMALRPAASHAPIRGTYLSRRHPELVVIDKQNGGEADALNAAIGVAQHPYVCAVHAGVTLEPDGLMRLAKPFLDDPHLVVATGGIARVANGSGVAATTVERAGLPRGRLAMLQVVEYCRVFLVGRVAWGQLQSPLITSSAVGLFPRATVDAIGGWRAGAAGEDIDLVIRLHRYHRDRDEERQVLLLPDPVCWTEVPEEIGALARQRRRWQRGLAEILAGYRDAALRPRYGRMGLVAIPYLLVFEVLGPVLAGTSYVLLPGAWLLGLLPGSLLLSYLLVAVLVGQLLSMSALALDELAYRRRPHGRDLARLVWYGAVENLGYRQLTDVSKTQGLWDFLRRRSGRGAPSPAGDVRRVRRLHAKRPRSNGLWTSKR